MLLQLVAKRLLTDYGRRLAKPDAAALAAYAGQAAGDAVSRSGLRALGQRIADFGSTARSVGNVRGEAAQRQLLTDRVETIVAGVAGRLKNAGSLSAKDAAALFNENQNELIEAAYAHAELLEWEAFSERLATIEHAGNKQVLTWLRDLFGFTLIERHLAWYLINGRLSASRAASITDYIDDRLLPRLRPHAVALTDAFQFAPEHLRAPIATGAERARQDEARAYYAAQKASGTAPVEEKTLAKKKSGADS